MDSNCSSKAGNVIPFINLIAIDNQMIRNNIVAQLDKFLISLNDHDCIFKPIYNEELRLWTVKCAESHENQDMDKQNTTLNLKELNQSQESNRPVEQQKLGNEIEGWANNINENQKSLEALNGKLNDETDDNKDEENESIFAGAFNSPVAALGMMRIKRNPEKAFMGEKLPSDGPVDKIYTDLKQKLIVTNANYKENSVATEITFQNEKDFNMWYNAADLFSLESASKGESYRKITTTKALMEPTYSYTWTVIADLDIVTKNGLNLECWEDIIKTFIDKVKYPCNIDVDVMLGNVNSILVTLVFIYLCTHPCKVEYTVDEINFKSALYQHLMFQFKYDLSAGHKIFTYAYEDTKLGFYTKIQFNIEFRPTKIEGVPFLKFYSIQSKYPWEYNSLTSYLDLFKPLMLKEVELDNNTKNIVIHSKD